jgi:hypothetical protein
VTAGVVKQRDQEASRSAGCIGVPEIVREEEMSNWECRSRVVSAMSLIKMVSYGGKVVGE